MPYDRIRDPVAAFLYALMENQVPPGTVERMVQDVEKSTLRPNNAHLMEYSSELAQRLIPKLVRNTRAATDARWKDGAKDE